jgi:hypothetical protein
MGFNIPCESGSIHDRIRWVNMHQDQKCLRVPAVNIYTRTEEQLAETDAAVLQ